MGVIQSSSDTYQSLDFMVARFVGERGCGRGEKEKEEEEEEQHGY